jgi:hypothetical protein
MEIADFLRLVGFVALWIAIFLIGVYWRRYQREQAAREFVSDVRREMEAHPITLNIIPIVSKREPDLTLPTYDQIMRGKHAGTALLSMQGRGNPQ